MIIRAMEVYPDAVFLDIGSNIGMFSLAVAAIGRQSVALDLVADNLAYQRLSLLSMKEKRHKTVGNIKFIHNAISFKHEIVFGINQIDENNQGAMAAIRAVEVEEQNLWNDIRGEAMTTITLQDLLDSLTENTVIVKIDIEGDECWVLTPDVLSNSRGTFLPYILMEWHQVTSVQECNVELSERFTRAGYIPLHPFTGQDIHDPLNNGYESEEDILWKHKTANPLPSDIIKPQYYVNRTNNDYRTFVQWK